MSSSYFYIFRDTPSVRQRLIGMIRVVHGTEDVHALIRRAVLSKATNSKTKHVFSKNRQVQENDQIQGDEHGEILETNMNGVWSLMMGSRLFESNFKAVEVIMRKVI